MRFLVFSVEVGRNGERGIGEIIDARLSVTQSDDPRSGGHFCLGVSKPPLMYNEKRKTYEMKWTTHSGSARERSRIII